MISLAVIEDNLETKAMLELLLSNLPEILFVGIAATGKDGIKLIVEKQPDVAIVDLGLPDTSGIDCIQIMKAQCPQTEFIVFTTSEEDSDIFDAIKAGASSYLLKSTSPAELVKSIKEVHEGGSAITSSIARKMISHFSATQKKSSQDASQRKESFGITDREEELLTLLAQGLQYKEVADQLFIAVRTVKSHIYRIYEKLQVDNRTEAVNKYFGNNL